MSEPTHQAELAAFQDALARLTPAPDGISIARLLFRAGQLSASQRGWAWPCATAASMLLATTLGFTLLLRPVPEPTERIVTVYLPAPPSPPLRAEPVMPMTGETPAPPSPSPPVGEEMARGDGDYLQLRRQVLAHGLDTLPLPQPWPVVTPADDTETLLDLPHGSHEPWLQRLKRSLNSGGPL